MIDAEQEENKMSDGYKDPLRTDMEASIATVESAGSVQYVVPVLAEDVVVEKRVVEKDRVRVHKTIHEREEIIDEPLNQEIVEVERVPVNRIVERPIPTRQEGDVTIISVTKEVLVVEKRLLCTEEVRITRRISEGHDPQRVTLRNEEVTVERIPAAEAPNP
jgi:stress response protein YsnF